MMWKTAIAVVGVALCLGAQTALAAVDCGRQPDLAPSNSTNSFKADASGKAQLFSKILPQAEIKGNVEEWRTEQHQNYNNIDRQQKDLYFQWVSCQNIMSSAQMSDQEKQKQWSAVLAAFGERVNYINSLNRLQVAAEMFDSRGANATGPVHHTFNKTFRRGDEYSAGREIAAEMIGHLNLLPHSAALRVTLVNERGKLRLQDDVPGGFASLHATRFEHVMTLADLSKQPINSIEFFSNVGPGQLHLPRKEIDPGNLDWASRAGVYRIAVTAPFYDERVLYAELSSRGDVYAPSKAWYDDRGPNKPIRTQSLNLPFFLTLARSGDDLKIALPAIDVIGL